MSDRYWDVDSCTWAGGEAVAPDAGPAAARAGVLPALPAQATSEQVESSPSPAQRAGAAPRTS